MADQDIAEDSRFVDHVETKLLSPVKESWTPSKGFFMQVEDTIEGQTKNNNSTIKLDVVDAAINGADLIGGSSHEIKENGIKENGFVEESRSDDHSHEHFVDRQESLIESDEPDTIKSPVKVVDTAFGFVKTETDSLDAVNNNSDSPKPSSDFDKNDINNANYKTEINQYLGKEVVLHGNKISQLDMEIGGAKNNNTSTENDQNDQNSGENDASVNLYWYSTNLEIDPAELEAFKQSQDGASYTSTLNVSFQDGYYKDKLGTSEKMNSQELSKLASTKKPEEKDTWSMAFGSVSSHCLDVASSLKSEPKTKKNNENVSIKEAGSSHPWGLERENKVIEKSEALNELPSIDSEFTTDLMTKVDKNTIELDDADGTGYSELDDKDEIKRKVMATELKIVENPGDIGAQLHESDAIGYMELSDKEEIKLKMKYQEYLEKGKNGNVKESQNKVNKRDLDLDLDESDAIGYMELKDRNDILQSTQGTTDRNTDNQQRNVDNDGTSEQFVEEVISVTETSVSYSANTESNIAIETTERYAQDMSKQIVTSVAKHIDENDSKDVGLDQPDGTKKSVEEPIQRKVQKVTKTALKSFDVKPTEKYHPLDVKRKFNLSNDTEKRIKDLGGKLVNTEVFVDEYLDDSFYSILLHDCWLRLRNKEFQMKMKSNLHGNHYNMYPETTVESEIKEVIGAIFKSKNKKDDKPLDVLIDEIGLTEFVTIETTRKTYQLNGFIVDLDLTSLGAAVGDIGVVIDRPGKIVPQLQQLDQLAKQIGMLPLQSA